jgi:hypothetical protein
MVLSDPFLGNESAALLRNHFCRVQHGVFNLIQCHHKAMSSEDLKLVSGMAGVVNTTHIPLRLLLVSNKAFSSAPSPWSLWLSIPIWAFSVELLGGR